MARLRAALARPVVAVVAVLVALGGLVQINPVWQYGPFEIWLGTNGAQPDWYLGWLIGALRLMPSFDIVIAGRTVIPNPFFGGVLFPAALFALLYAWPLLERRITGDRAVHHLLDRPRDAPGRTAAGAALFALVSVIFVAGSADRIFVSLGISYERQVSGCSGSRRSRSRSRCSSSSARSLASCETTNGTRSGTPTRGSCDEPSEAASTSAEPTRRSHAVGVRALASWSSSAASSSGRSTIGKCPPGISTGSTCRSSRAMKRSHSGVKNSSSAV